MSTKFVCAACGWRLTAAQTKDGKCACGLGPVIPVYTMGEVAAVLARDPSAVLGVDLKAPAITAASVP